MHSTGPDTSTPTPITSNWLAGYRRSTKRLSSRIQVDVRAVSTAQAQRMAENDLPGWTAYHATVAG